MPAACTVKTVDVARICESKMVILDNPPANATETLSQFVAETVRETDREGVSDKGPSENVHDLFSRGTWTN